MHSSSLKKVKGRQGSKSRTRLFRPCVQLSRLSWTPYSAVDRQDLHVKKSVLGPPF